MAGENGFQPGDIIQDYCDPFVKILFDHQKGSRCDFCFNVNPRLLRCAGCLLMHYCDKKCQTRDWKEAHRFECKSAFFKKPIRNALQPGDFKRQICRLFAVLKLHPDRGQKQYPLYNGSFRSFNDLISHQATLEKDVKFQLFSNDMATDLEAEGSFSNNDEGISYLIHLAGVWKTNAFSILNENESVNIGSGIFIEPSVFDHSCKPNALFVLQGCKMQIRAIGPVAKDEKPCVTYIVGHRTKKERGDLLLERYNFVCKCERCVLEENGNLVNYEKLKTLIALSRNQYKWKEYKKTHEEILLLMRKVYHEYDERITNHCFLTFQEAAPLGAPQNAVQKLAESAEEHLRLTFGTQSRDYQTYLGLTLH